jgi:hypothetical protein
MPAIAVVRRWFQSLAVLDAIVCADWEYRYLSFDEQFGPGQALASMRNGSGDEYSITFAGGGALLRGFDHESPLSPFIQTPPTLWPGLLTGLPAALAILAEEPALTLDGVPMVTIALWRLGRDAQWHHGQIATRRPGRRSTQTLTGQAGFSRNSMAGPKATCSTQTNTSNASCPPKQSRRS